MSNTNFVPRGTAILNSSSSAHASSASASEGAASRSARTYSRRPTAVRLGRRGDTRGVGLSTMATPLTDRSSSAVPTRSLPCAGSTMPAASCMIRSRTTKWLKSQWMIAGSGSEERSGRSPGRRRPRTPASRPPREDRARWSHRGSRCTERAPRAAAARARDTWTAWPHRRRRTRWPRAAPGTGFFCASAPQLVRNGEITREATLRWRSTYRRLTRLPARMWAASRSRLAVWSSARSTR